MKKILLSIFLCIQFLAYASENIENIKYKILVGSLVHQNPNILKEFLESLKMLEKESFTLDFFFIEDDNVEESKQLLKNFKNEVQSNSLIVSSKDELTSQVEDFKDKMIEKTLNENYDYLLLIDSNIVLHPKTINKLVEAKKDIISSVFWTKNNKNSHLFSQSLVSDQYSLYKHEKNKEEIIKKNNDFFNMLKKPGIYEVGGLESLILINKESLKKGLSFKKISNLTINGDYRHFCIRAVALGLLLFVDTHYPAFSISSESDLLDIGDFKQKGEIKSPRLTLSMIIHNEADRYLRKVLEKAKEYITDAVIIDDASTDNSAQICLEVLKGIPLHIVVNNKSKFANEVELRKQQWEETIKTNPEWIIILDADEIFEDKFKDKVKELIKAKEVDAYYFTLYDFWNDTHYRDDKHWKASHIYHPKLVRYIPNIEYKWFERPFHCGRCPKTINQFKKAFSNLRLKHYGWSKHEDRIAKYQRNQKLDPEGKYVGGNEIYESILDENPRLIKWIE